MAKAKTKLSYIAEALRPLAVELGEIKVDERNARSHSDENLASITASLSRYGQRQPLVVNRKSSVIEAGNARYLCAQQLGWSHVAVVFVDDDAASATGFAIADNRTAELAEWNDELLVELLGEVRTSDEQFLSDFALEAMLADEAAQTVGQTTTTTAQTVPELYQVIANCENEAKQKELYERLCKEGYEVKLLVI